jgi:uncharacterized membrane protein YdjX (TVP38/TMEM64 family)
LPAKNKAETPGSGPGSYNESMADTGTTNTTALVVRNTTRRNRVVFTIIALVIMALVGFYLWRPTTDFQDFLGLLHRGGPIPFFICFAVLPLAGVPGTPFLLIAGAAFGPWVSLIGMAAALAVQLSLAYWLAHRYLHQFLERLARKTKYGVPDVKPENHLKFAVLVRVTPGLPPFLKHYVISLAGVPFRTFFWVTWPISLVSSAALILLGDAAFDRDIEDLAVLAVVVIVLFLLYKIIRRRLERQT